MKRISVRCTNILSFLLLMAIFRTEPIVHNTIMGLSIKIHPSQRKGKKEINFFISFVPHNRSSSSSSLFSLSSFFSKQKDSPSRLNVLVYPRQAFYPPPHNVYIFYLVAYLSLHFTQYV